MTNTKRTFIATGVALATSLILGNSALAAQTVLKIATFAPAKHQQNAHVFPKFKAMLEKATEGRVTIKLEYGLGHPGSFFDMVEDGTVDGAWSFHGYQAGRFETYKFAEMPLYSYVDAGKTSEAIWETVNKFYNNNGEYPGYKGLHLVGLWVHPPTQLHLKKPITDWSEVKNMKVGVGGGISKALAESLGMTGVGMPASKAYEAMQQGVTDGHFVPYQAHNAFRFKEVAPHVVKIDSYAGIFGFVLNKNKLATLSAKDRKAVESISGAVYSKMAGETWAAIDKKAYAQLQSTGMLVTSEKLTKQFRERTKNIAIKWLKSREGVDPKSKQAHDYFVNKLK